MTKEIIYAVNVTLDAYSIIVSLIITGSILLFKRVDKSVKWFAYTNLAAIVFALSDILMWISEGTDAHWKLIVLPVSSFVFFLSGILLFLFYIQYIINYYRNTNTISNNYTYFCIALVLIYLGFLIATLFTDCIYTISADNVYHRGRFFNSTVIIEILIYMEALLLIFKYHKNARNFENIGFASFIFVPFICHIIQLMNFGIALTSLGLSISFMIIYLNLNQKMKETLENVQEEFLKKEIEHVKRQQQTIYSLTSLIESRDLKSTNHEIRLAKYVELLAQKCAQTDVYSDILTEEYINNLVKAVPFHDIGKINIPENILKKNDVYNFSEMDLMKKHTEYGERIANDVLSISYNSEFTNLVSKLCRSHHEKWNGRGYPDNLKGNDIPLCARFMAIADAFDAMVTWRCYKKSVSYDEAFDIIKNEAGEQFDPLLASEFIRLRKKIIEINEKYKDNSFEG